MDPTIQAGNITTRKMTSGRIMVVIKSGTLAATAVTDGEAAVIAGVEEGAIVRITGVTTEDRRLVVDMITAVIMAVVVEGTETTQIIA